jgi:ubiquinone/menaquinone biosynthesis C-methylase UbiE
VGSSTHRELTQREFARQSSNFEQAGSLFRDDSILGWIADNVTVPRGARVLDVAGGSGQVGRYITRSGGRAFIVDVTDEMLQAGLRSVREEGRRDVTFVHGDAAELPFPGGQFDVVVSRFALHHMQDPAIAIREMARMCTPDGSVTIIDMVSGGARHDELERLRDPSHTRALAAEEFGELLATAGIPPQRFSEREQTMSVEPWLEQSSTREEDRQSIRAVLAAEADGGDASGLRAVRTPDGELSITQRWKLSGS